MIHAEDLTTDDRFRAGKALRERVPRKSQAGWSAQTPQRDPIALIESSSAGRLPNLIPVRYGRMAKSPFAFMRGTPILMAHDLGIGTVTSGARVQACGDCHLENFGVFATPERNVIFDINDFDETLPGPWEFDLKRLAVSAYVAGRSIGCTEGQCFDAGIAAARGYREELLQSARMTAIEVWYRRVDARTLSSELAASALGSTVDTSNRPAPGHIHTVVAESFTEVIEGGGRRIADRPPFIYHLPEDDATSSNARAALRLYQESLRDDVAMLFSRYSMTDLAMKVVGIGSVGTRCAIALFSAGSDDALLLQIKEARSSVLEPWAGPSRYTNAGQRIVAGQQLMQSASDIFLGWTSTVDGRDFYVRQLKDMKASIKIAAMSAAELEAYSGICGQTLAIAHARSGDAAMIAGYIGKTQKFDRYVGKFARTYADWVAADYDAFLHAIDRGRLSTEAA